MTNCNIYQLPLQYKISISSLKQFDKKDSYIEDQT
jgi:hypothetical protein